MTPASLHLITGGQRSGKSRHAEALGQLWLAGSAGSAREVAVVATAQAGDDEMRARIDRHRADRPRGFQTLEVPWHLGAALRAWGSPQRLLIVDCLTLWVTNWWTPCGDAVGGSGTEPLSGDWPAARADFLQALVELRERGATVLLVGNEIGSGVVPMGAAVRQFVDEVGRLNQAVAERCDWVTLMAAGQPFTQPVPPVGGSVGVRWPGGSP